METLDTNPLQPPAEEAQPPAPETPPEEVQLPTETPPPQGFGSLTTHSFQVLFKNIHRYLILSFILLIPVAVVMAGLYFWAQSGLAAPKLPGSDEIPPVVEEVMESGNEANIETLPVLEGVGIPPPVTMPKGAQSFDDLGLAPNIAVTKPGIIDFAATTGVGNMAALAGMFSTILLILMIPFILYQFFAMLAFFRLTALIDKREDISYGGILKWSLKKIGSFILLTLRIFIYTWAWLFFVILFIPLIFPPAMFVLPFIYIILAFVVIVKGLSTVMAQYALADKDCSSKEALQYSIEISKKRRAQIFAYMFVLGLIIGLVSGGLTFVVNFAGELIAAIASIFMIIVIMCFYRLLEMWYAEKTVVVQPEATSPVPPEVPPETPPPAPPAQ